MQLINVINKYNGIINLQLIVHQDFDKTFNTNNILFTPNLNGELLFVETTQHFNNICEIPINYDTDLTIYKLIDQPLIIYTYNTVIDSKIKPSYYHINHHKIVKKSIPKLLTILNNNNIDYSQELFVFITNNFCNEFLRIISTNLFYEFSIKTQTIIIKWFIDNTIDIPDTLIPSLVTVIDDNEYLIKLCKYSKNLANKKLKFNIQLDSNPDSIKYILTFNKLGIIDLDLRYIFGSNIYYNINESILIDFIGSIIEIDIQMLDFVDNSILISLNDFKYYNTLRIILENTPHIIPILNMDLFSGNIKLLKILIDYSYRINYKFNVEIVRQLTPVKYGLYWDYFMHFNFDQYYYDLLDK